MATFSQRMGYKPMQKEIQIESIDIDSKNSLWNAFNSFLLQILKDNHIYRLGDYKLNQVVEKYWIYHFKLPYDKAPETAFSLASYFDERYAKFSWIEVLEFIEFSINLVDDKAGYVDALNKHLERESSGYRIINNEFAPITSELELNEINSALDASNNFTSIKGANIHLEKALNHLSSRESPDYRNSIKESVSAVETAARVITGENSLGKALGKIEYKLSAINGQLKESFNKLYNYTNAPDSGIRHAAVDGHVPPDFETAKYILVTSSAFINYLVGLSVKADLI